MLILVCLLAVPALVACTSMWFYRKKLLQMLPDLPRKKATKEQHFRFKARPNGQAAAAEAGENPTGLGVSPSRSLTMRPDEVPREDGCLSKPGMGLLWGPQDHMQSLVLDGDEVVEMRQASKTSACSHKASQVSSGDAEDENGHPVARAGSIQSVAGKKKGRSQSKLSLFWGVGPTPGRPEPQLQMSRSVSDGQLQTSPARTLGDQPAFRDSLALMLYVMAAVRGEETWTSTHSQLFGSSLLVPGAVPSESSPRRQGSKGSNKSPRARKGSKGG
eukprot:Skav214814  [mRNA]  locus=scaffold1934:125246:127033:- [translate_table: standard]